MKTGAEAIQEGGSHYKGMGIEPFRFAMENDWDAGAFSILKHVSRHKLKAGLIDLRKAKHYVQLRMEQWGPWLYPKRPSPKIAMVRYCQANKITGDEMLILFALENWVHDQSVAASCLAEINRHLDKLIAGYEHEHEEMRHAGHTI